MSAFSEEEDFHWNIMPKRAALTNLMQPEAFYIFDALEFSEVDPIPPQMCFRTKNAKLWN